MNFNRIKLFFQKIRRLLESRKGAWEQEEPGKRPVLCYIIGGVKYLVSAYFKENSSLSAEDKITRLIEQDMENTEKRLDAQSDSEQNECIQFIRNRFGCKEERSI